MHGSVFLAQTAVPFRPHPAPQSVCRLLRPGSRSQMADFGFVKKVLPGQRTSTLCGTPEYLAPELITGEGHWQAADWRGSSTRAHACCACPRIAARYQQHPAAGAPRPQRRWSVGVLAYELVAGMPPFMSDDRMVMYRKIVDCSFSCPAHFSLVRRWRIAVGGLHPKPVYVWRRGAPRAGHAPPSRSCAT